MEFAKTVLEQTVSFLVSIGILGILGFIFKEFVKKAVSFYFKPKELSLEYNKERDIETFRRALSCYEEIDQMVHIIRNGARDIVARDTPITPHRSVYTDNLYLLTQRLYQYKALLGHELFEEVHYFKRLNQDFLIYLDSSDRDESLKKNKTRFAEEILTRLRDLYEQINALHERITTRIEDRVHPNKKR